MLHVSVIIPNYNHADFLEKRIQSVLEQTYPSYELILLDDNSTDHSREIIERYRNHEKVSHVIYNKSNAGAFSQWKRGIDLAKGGYIWIAESDDHADNRFLERLMQPFHEDPDVILSYCRSKLINQYDEDLGLHLWMDRLDNQKWTQDYVADGHHEASKYLEFRNTICNASSVVFKKINGVAQLIPTEMEFCGDWLFWKRLLKKQGKIAYTHLPLSFFRDHNQTTRSVSTEEKELKRFEEYRGFISSRNLSVFESRYDWMLREWINRRHLFHNKKHQFSQALKIRYAFLLMGACIHDKLRQLARYLPQDGMLFKSLKNLYCKQVS